MLQDPLPGFGALRPEDPELDRVAGHLRTLDPDGGRMARALRRSIDMLLDGKNTGRYRWDQLHKTEKTHCGTLVEINLQREFRFADGKTLDYAIEDVEIDCKFSQQLGEWMIPPEAVDRLLLGVWASDEEGRWCAGVVRARERFLAAPNRDSKRRLTTAGRDDIAWLHRMATLPENALLRLPPPDVKEIFGCSHHGSRRVDELFRRAQRRIISRAVVATVAQQEDYMKRVRGNGGSRSALRDEGIVILGQYGSHQAIARQLGLPVPGPGESVSVRLTRRAPHHGEAAAVTLDGADWVVAVPGDPPEAAPLLPDIRR